MSSENAAIEAMIAEYVKHQIDPDPFLALHTEDTVIVNVVGRRVLGKPDLRAAMTEALKTPLAQVRTTLDVEDIRFARPDVAVVSVIKRVHDERDEKAFTDKGFPKNASMTMVLVKDNGDWRVAVAHTTPRQPA